MDFLFPVHMFTNWLLLADYFCSVKIVDESYPKPGIPVNFFMAHMENLPSVGSPGDIIQLSRVVVDIYDLM
jgi:hypothetical protein